MAGGSQERQQRRSECSEKIAEGTAELVNLEFVEHA